MTINLKLPDVTDLKPRIVVFGVGGAGGNAVNNMIESKLEGVEFVVANTDAQALSQSAAERRVQMGTALTEGLGAGSEPQIGAAAAEEAMPEIADHLTGTHMTFITAGMGGGTGTGAAPIIARASKEQGILTVGVVTKPFHFEGQRRMITADAGIELLAQNVDTLIVIPNQNLFRVANEKTTFADAFAMADEVLHSGVAGVTDLMVKEGLINLDFADVRAIMSGMGKAMMGTGEATGEKRAIEAAEAAISNPLLDDVSMKGARGLLISITGGKDLTLYEVDEAATRIREEVDPDANIILGATFDESLEGVIRVSVVATGVHGATQLQLPADNQFIADQTGQFAATDPAAQATQIMDPALAPAAQAPAAQAAAVRGGEYDADIQVAGSADQAAVDGAGYVTEPAPETVPDHDQSYIPPAAADAGQVLPRMPDVDDFPPIAVRELKARDGEGEELGIEAQKKRVGFFERLANVGLGRKEPAAKPVAHIEPSFGASPAPPREDAAPAPQADGSQPAPAPEDNDDHPYLKAIDGTQDPEFEDVDLEIPAFLRRQAN
jgi:cell division protein FtsZ